MFVAAVLVAGVTGSVAAQTVVSVSHAAGLSRPVCVTWAPGDQGQKYVAEQPGRVRRLDAGGNITGTLLDLSPVIWGGTTGEAGLLGLAMAPDFLTSGTFYVTYTRVIEGVLTSVVEEFRLGPDSTADPLSGRRILDVPQLVTNHNVGWMGFGPDGHLSIAVGDGGGGNDPKDNASSLASIKGKILRIDVSDDSVPYTIPASNPFVGVVGAREEIWVYGLRNPWRDSFDRVTGDLWIGDVGQSGQEEINRQLATSPGGEHFGWRCREGDFANTAVAGCPGADPLWAEPFLTYNRESTSRCAVTGGYVYRGCALGTELYGHYFYGDFCSGEIWSLDPETGISTLRTTVSWLASYGEDELGELYAVSLIAGRVFQLLPGGSGGDTNGNGVPDACECAADLNGDGILDNGDIGAFIQLFLSGC
ncbi:MAG: glucose/arabinose dehydrogenase [Phycisphaerales bacterium]|jgi:glucose/arabinose dehydrogenase